MSRQVTSITAIRHQASAEHNKQVHGMDEVWEADHDDDCSSTCSGLDSISDCATPSTGISLSMTGDDRIRRRSATPPPRGQLDMLETLRKLEEDNARLREALVKSQRENEMLARDKSGESGNSVDFGHILALARELNDDFDVDGDVPHCTCDSQVKVFAMDSPRGDCPKEERDIEGDDETTKLRRELEESKAQAAADHAHFAARDAELRAKFQALWVAVCGGSPNANDVQTAAVDSDNEDSDDECDS